MANKTLLAQIKQRSDTAANWTAKNPVIGDGELIIVTTNAGEKRFKVGDGEKTFTQLPYADENILSKIKTYTAGDGISISDTGVISSTGGGSGSDVFVIEMTTSTTFSKTFNEIKAAIQAKKSLIGIPANGTIPLYGYYWTQDNFEYISLDSAISGAAMHWFAQKATSSTDEPTWTYETVKVPNAATTESNSGAAYWNSTNKKWEIKDITSTTYKAGNGISISNDGTISVTAAKIYSGTSNAPSADLGENGDIYIQTEG